jgi:hypothetical protein
MSYGPQGSQGLFLRAAGLEDPTERLWRVGGRWDAFCAHMDASHVVLSCLLAASGSSFLSVGTILEGSRYVHLWRSWV